MSATPQVVKLPAPQSGPTSRVVFTQGGKGGVGKTAFTTMLVEWYRRAQHASRVNRYGH